MPPSIVTQALRQHAPTQVRHEKLRQAIAKELIESRPTNKGRGLFALADFAPGEVIAIVDGTVTYGTDRDVLAGAGDDYSIFFHVGDKLQRITPRVKEIGWHVANQSCAPNAKIGESFMAVRGIRAGDEITTCYGWFTAQSAATKCLCGVSKCFGKLGPKVAGGKIDPDDLRAFIANQIENENAIGLESTLGQLGVSVFPPEWLPKTNALIASIPKRFDYRIAPHKLREMGFYVD
jgi:hypothetical protein